MQQDDQWAAFNPQPASSAAPMASPAIRPLTPPAPKKPEVRSLGDTLVTVDGTNVTPIYTAPPKPEKDEKVQEAERTAAFLATRVAGGIHDISNALKAAPSQSRPGVMATIAGIAGDDARNFANSEGRQRIEAAQMDVLDAALTLGTGAAYSPEQLRGYSRSYFPQLGDTDQTVADKRIRLQRLLEAAKVKAGGAAPQIDQALAAIDAIYPSQGGEAGTGRTTLDIPNDPNEAPPLEVEVTGGTDPAREARVAEMLKQHGSAGAAGVVGAGDTLSFGLSDELLAGAKAVGGSLSGDGSFGDLYAQNVGDQRAYQEQLQQAHPYAFFGGQLIGGLPVPFGAAASGAKGLGIAGAAQGAAYGFGSGEGNALQRTPGAAIGGAAGGAIGATLGAVAKPAQNALMRFSPQGQSARAAEVQAARPVIEAGQRQGIPIRQPDVRPGKRGDLAALEKSPSAGPMVGDTLRADRDALANKVGTLAKGEAKDEYSLGNEVQGAVERHNQRTKDEATVNYFRAKRMAPGHKVENPPQTFAAIDEKIGELKATGESANAAEIKVLEGIKSDLKKSGLSIDSLQVQRRQMRQRLKDGGIDTPAPDASYMEVMKIAGQELEGSLASNPNAQNALRKANAHYAERKAFREQVAKTFTGTKNAPVPPETAAQRFISMSKGKGDYNRFSRMLGEMEGEERGNLAATIAEGLGRSKSGEFGFGKFVTDLESMNPRAIRDLYGKEGAEALSDLKIIAAAKRDAAGALNHSNTGSVVARQNGFKDTLLAMFGGGVAGVPGAIAGYFARGSLEKFTSKRAARMLLNPDFTKWLRQTPNSGKPEVINRHFARLTSVASRSPALAADAKALQQTLMEAFGTTTRAAASSDGTDPERN